FPGLKHKVVLLHKSRHQPTFWIRHCFFALSPALRPATFSNISACARASAKALWPPCCVGRKSGRMRLAFVSAQPGPRHNQFKAWPRSTHLPVAVVLIVPAGVLPAAELGLFRPGRR